MSPDPKDAPAVPHECYWCCEEEASVCLHERISPEQCPRRGTVSPPVKSMPSAVPEALQRAAEAAAEEIEREGVAASHTSVSIVIRHVLAAKVCTEPEHKLPAAFVNSLRERAEAAEQALAAAQALADERLTLLELEVKLAGQYMAERDAYKRAKAENDDRFMIERDEARAERDAALERAKAAEQRAEEESEYAALVAAGIKHWQGCPNNAATGGTELSPCLRCQVETLARERDEATAKLEKAQRAIWHMRYRNHEFSIGCAGCMDAETTLAALDSQPK